MLGRGYGTGGYSTGGYGTLDELFEMATLIQTGRLKSYPIVLVGTAYWQPLMDFLKSSAAQIGTISEDDLDMLFLTDSLDDAITHIKRTIHAI